MSQINLCLRVDSDIKKQCESLFSELGLNMSTAVNIFFRRCIRDGGIPFDVNVRRPNAETLEALQEAESLVKDAGAVRYHDVESALAELKR